MKSPRFAPLFLPLCLVLTLPSLAIAEEEPDWQTLNQEPRTWTSTSGTSIEARVLSVRGGQVVLHQTGEREPISLDISQLSTGDQEILESVRAVIHLSKRQRSAIWARTT